MLKAGFSQICITPPVGVDLSGWPFGPAVAVLNELEAQAAAFDDGNTRSILITADVLGFSRSVVDNVRSRLEQGTGVPSQNIILSASHTHSGPVVALLRRWGEPNRKYIERLEDLLVELGHRALMALNPVTVASGVGRADDCVENRRGLKDMVDPSVPVIRFDNADGEFQAIIWNFGCHPVALHNYRNTISPDYVGYVRDEIRRLLGRHVVVMFTLGGAGDTNPAGFNYCNTSITNARGVGNTLATEVVRVARNLKPVDAEFRFAHKKYALPYEALPSATELQKIREENLAEAANARTNGLDIDYITDRKIFAEWADAALAELKKGAMCEGPYEVQSMKIGDAGIITDELETYSATALGVKAAFPGKTIMMASNCNTAAGYLPTADAYDKKEDYTNPSNLAPKVYGIYAFARAAESICRQTMIDTLNQVFDDTP